NRIDITTRKIKQFALELDRRSIDFRKPLRIVVDGKEQTLTAQPSLRILCQSMLDRGDPQLAITCRVHLTTESK
ncbi:MAG: hypothetical protein ACRELG_27300, partial [Gemmataceae bacterium]